MKKREVGGNLHAISNVAAMGWTGRLRPWFHSLSTLLSRQSSCAGFTGCFIRHACFMHEPFRQHFRYLASGVVIGPGKGERERRGEEKRKWVKRGSDRERWGEEGNDEKRNEDKET